MKRFIQRITKKTNGIVIFRLSLLFLIFLIFEHGTNGQSSIPPSGGGGAIPDLDKALRVAKATYPHVDSLDRAMNRLSYFDQHTPTKDEQAKLIEIYKAASNGYMVNVRYKLGYMAYQEYLSLKDKKLTEEKANAIEQAKSQYEEKNRKDEAQVQTLQNEANELNKNINTLISRRSSFKRIFSIIIVILSALFAASLFRSGVRLKDLRDEVQANQDKLMQNHRIALLGSFAQGLRETILKNYEMIKKDAQELLARLTKDNEKIKAIKAKLEELVKG